ncbi:hypothetical protein TNCV_4175501 [Trichonephila clavipes]|nr:hypothetical protein TNCV_4175501 [Trichonephila clavipes]
MIICAGGKHLHHPLSWGFQAGLHFIHASMSTGSEQMVGVLRDNIFLAKNTLHLFSQFCELMFQNFEEKTTSNGLKDVGSSQGLPGCFSAGDGQKQNSKDSCLESTERESSM